MNAPSTNAPATGVQSPGVQSPGVESGNALSTLAWSELTAEIVEAVPIGLAVFDADQRLVLMNAAYYASLALPPSFFVPGTTLEETMRQAAYRGVFGPGDPEIQLRQQMQLDRSRPGQLRRRHFNGRSYDLLSVPLQGGGHLVSAVETTSFIEARDTAETLAGRMVGTVSNLRIGLAAFGPDSCLSLFNPRFAELLGAPVDQLRRGMAFTDLLAALRASDDYGGRDDQDFLDHQASLQRALPGNARRICANGQVVDLASDPLPDGGWTITISDVSTLAQAEDDARRRALMLDVLVQSIPHGIIVFGPDRRVRMFNRAYAKVMEGAPVAIGDHLDDIILRRNAAGEFGPQGMASVFTSAADLDFSRAHARPRRQRPNGMFIDVDSVPLPDGGHVSVVSDVTQLAQAEAALARRAAEMEAMLAHTRHGLTLWALDKTLIAGNAMAAELLELPLEFLTRGLSQEALLRSMQARGAFGMGEAAEAHVLNTLSNDPTQPWMTERLTSAGRILEVRSSPAVAQGYTVVTYTDITESRRGAQELEEAVAAARAANASKARFLATMSHELRTPLNSVIGFSDTLMRDRGATEPSQAREYAEDINTAGKRLLLLINNVLDVARIEAGRFDLGTDRIDVIRMAQSCMRQFRNMANVAEVELLNDMPAALPLMRGDERRMQQVMVNLVSNAVKFTDPGGTVTLFALVEDQGDLVVQVSDTGIGIAEDQITHMFEPFTQLDAGLARRFEGSGLGLYFSRALVQAHGGTLTLHSVLGQGTTAEIRMPASRLAGS